MASNSQVVVPSISVAEAFRQEIDWLANSGWLGLLRDGAPGDGVLGRRRRETLGRAPDGWGASAAILRAIRSQERPCLGMYAVVARVLRRQQPGTPDGAWPLPARAGARHRSSYHEIWQVWAVQPGTARLIHQVPQSSSRGRGTLRGLLLGGGWHPGIELCVLDDYQWDGPSLRWLMRTGCHVTVIPEPLRRVAARSVPTAISLQEIERYQRTKVWWRRIMQGGGLLLTNRPHAESTLAEFAPAVGALAQTALQRIMDYTPRRGWAAWATLLELQSMCSLLSDPITVSPTPAPLTHRRIWGVRGRTEPRLWNVLKPASQQAPANTDWPADAPVPRIWAGIDQLADWMRSPQLCVALAKSMGRTADAIRLEIEVGISMILGREVSSKVGGAKISDSSREVCPALAAMTDKAGHVAEVPQSARRAVIAGLPSFARAIRRIPAWQQVIASSASSTSVVPTRRAGRQMPGKAPAPSKPPRSYEQLQLPHV